MAGKPVSVVISGMQITIDLKEGAPNFAMPQSPAPAAKLKVSIPWLPELKLSDSAIYLQMAAGDITMDLSGGIGEIQSGQQEIQLNVVTAASFLQAKAVFKASFDNQGKLQGRVLVPEAWLDTPEVRIANFSSDTSFTIVALQLQQMQTDTKLSGIRLLRRTETLTSELVFEEMVLTGEVQESSDSMLGNVDFKIADGQVSADALKLEHLSVSIPARIKFTPTSAQIGLREQGQVALGKIHTDYSVQIENFQGFSIDQADLDIVNDTHGLKLRHAISITPANLTLLDKRPESSERKALIHPGRISLIGKRDDDEKYRGTLTVSDAAVNLLSQIQASDISVILQLNGQKDDDIANFTIGQLRHLASEPLFAAMSFSGAIRDTADEETPAVYALELKGGIPALDYLKLTGRYTTSTGNGMLKFEIAPLSFSPGALQPSDLSPLLVQLEDVSGKVHAHAQFRWNKDGVRSSGAKLGIHDLSFTRETIKLSDLNAMLNLDNLIAPSSAPHQSITIRRIDSGIPLENLLISYHIEGTTPPRLEIEKAQFSMINGIVSLVPTVIDPVAAQTDILFRIEDIDLETFFNLLKIDGLTEAVNG